MEYRRENGASFPGHPAAGLAEISSQHNNRGLFEHLAGKLDEAEREYHTALQLQPDNSAALSNYGFLLDHDPNTTEILYAAGVLHASTGNLDLSGKLLDRVLLLDARHAEAWSARAFVSLARRDYGTAMEHARRAIELAPENPRAH